MKFISEGTKSILFGAHSPIHSILVTIAWYKVYGNWPTWKELICIFLHDIGYIGTNYITDKSNAGHAELGTRLVHRWFGAYYGHLILGHSSSARLKFGIPVSKLELPDDYSWVIAPMWWLHWNNWLEGFDVPPSVWKQAMKTKVESKNMISGTDLFHYLKENNDAK